VTRSSSTKRSSRRTTGAPQQVRGKTAGNVATMESSTPSESKLKRAQRKGHGLQESDAYETWLDQRLKSLYRPLLDAPLPEDMLKLLRGRKPS
jgi:hypothetical protein